MPSTLEQSRTSIALGDLAYHQARILLLVDAVVKVPGVGRKLDGLTKLAKLDFLVRYPALARRVILEAEDDPRLEPTEDDLLETEAPMIRYRYGPWDSRYYPVVGALVGRGLAAYTRGRLGSVALRLTPAGRLLAENLSSSSVWDQIASRCEAVAEYAARLTGNQLKELIYERLPEIVSQAHGEVIQP